MRGKTPIIVAVVILVGLILLPVWHGLASQAQRIRPTLDVPADPSGCVEPAVYMTANHMDLLNRWREGVVRNGEHEYTSSTGRTFVMSLTGTCLGCHTTAEGFCDRCHAYADVDPDCWSCHVETGGAAR